MALLTIVQASKDFNINKGKIYRAIKSGKLTATLKDNVQYIDHTDMIRVFDSSGKNRTSSNRTEPKKNLVHEPNELYIKLLEKQLNESIDREKFYKQQIDEIREDFKSYRLLIEHKIQTDTDLKILNQTENEPSSQNELNIRKIETNPNSELELPVVQTPHKDDNKERKSFFNRVVKKLLKS